MGMGSIGNQGVEESDEGEVPQQQGVEGSRPGQAGPLPPLGGFKIIYFSAVEGPEASATPRPRP